MSIALRHAEPEDYPRVIAVLDTWWGGRAMSDMLPRLFFAHFRPTSFVAERDGNLAGFLCGFVSQTDPRRAYIHFAGVDPALRGQGVGRRLYERFFATVRALGCIEVECVTFPVNRASIAFHQSLGFIALPGNATQDDVPFTTDYDGRGGARVRLRRALDVDIPARGDAPQPAARTVGHWPRPDLGPAHVEAAARLCVETLRPHQERDWSLPAADLEWDCRQTLEHIADVLATYAARLAIRARQRLAHGHTTDPAWSLADLLAIVEARAAALSAVIAAAPPTARAWHRHGMADPCGWAAMAANELLAHTDDVARGLEIPFAPPDALLGRIISRLYPWAPPGFAPLATFRWCNGRAPLGAFPRQVGTWVWHCAPLTEWDGTMKTSAP